MCPCTQAQQAPGVLVQLLQLAADPAGDSGIRQVAVITFKNVVKRHWESRGKTAQIEQFTESDQSQLALQSVIGPVAVNQWTIV